MRVARLRSDERLLIIETRRVKRKVSFGQKTRSSEVLLGGSKACLRVISNLAG